ncbi:MAG TPA: peptidase S41 [Porphyromonadaceae bacterium]|jgi:Tol biopolymer transport system component/C-terminal processing protease CtpA/Prc|nr:peptidase S41 [Porphyromonadaceae bacterium]HBL34168.1 peptidase S41 [Porphyromonadaceae bacterium]HBX46197.1 peptidase S41 [Porphyromonadaceae bacterium]HCM19861.1 peptidase S41 [Porphyromonadaceae bacterium]
MKRSLFSALLLFFLIAMQGHSAPLWLRNSVLSPDGSEIAFTYKGNIYTVAVGGGKANQITSHPSHDTQPVWSPDGQKMAFASNREGSFDVFVVSKDGGTATRLTSHSANEYPAAFQDNQTVLFSANIQPHIDNQQFPSGIFTQLYQVDLQASRPEMFLPFHFEDVSIKDGKYLYTDKKGYEDTWRKHHTSSVTRDVWLYDSADGSHRKLSGFKGENRNAVWSSDGRSYFYLSEQDGSFNVYKAPLEGGSPVRITNFKDHPVRFLSADKKDNLCFSFNGELYYLPNNGKPKKISIEIVSDDFERDLLQQTLTAGATSIAVSPNGKEIAFIARGDVFVTSVEFSSTKQITDTPEQERNVDFSPDGRSLVYSSERGNIWNVYKTDLVRKDDSYFVYAKELKETQLTQTATSAFQPLFSPDGKEIAYLENRSEIRVLNLASNTSRKVMDGKFNYSYSDGDQWYQWSPDSKWILSDYIGVGGWNNKDVALIKADGSGQITDLTESGYTDVQAKWVLGGKAILFFSDRAGYRSHGSWGAQDDVYLMFLTGDAYDDFKLTKEERELKKELEKEQKKKDKDKDKGKEDDKTKEAEKDSTKAAEPLDFDLDNRRYRVERLTRHSSNLADAYLNKEGTKLYYLARFEKGYDLWEQDFLENSTKILSKDVGAGRLIADKDGKNIFLVSQGVIKKIAGGKVTNVSFAAPFNYRSAEERNYIFEHAWKQVKDKFYDKNLHGIDWEMYKDAYQRFLPHINNNFDFSEMLSEMLGELNASHTGARYGAPKTRWETAALGVFWDKDYNGDGLKIKEIMKGSPLLRSDSKLKPGVVIDKIDGKSIEAGKTYWHLLDGKVGKRVLLSAHTPDSGDRFEEFVKPISQGQENELLYRRWVEQREVLADKYSAGRIAYIHIQGMNSSSFRDVYQQLLGKYRNKEAVVIDTRFNGGGWLHDDLATLLSGKEYQQFKPRGQYIGSDPFNKWTKPSIVLMGESNYSNAHGFPWLYKELRIGKLVGAPVPGTMTAVWWEQQIDPSLVFGIPQVTVVDMKGHVLENTQLEPDVEVYNTPESLLSADDLQLKRAVEELLKEL